MPATEIVATVSAIVGIGSKLADAVKTVREAKTLTPQATKAITEAQDLVLSLQTRIFELQEKALSLQEQNRELREQIRQKEEWALEREKYEMRQMGRAWVVAEKGTDGPFYCPTCFKGRKFAVLSHLGRSATLGRSYRCPLCQAHIET